MSSLDLIDRKRLRRLVAESAPAARAVVLVGSFARGTAVRPISDLDVLVISEDSPKPDSDTHLVVIAPNQFRSRVFAGDDFAQWALRYGTPVSGRRWWSTTRRELSNAPWPSSCRKFELADKRLAIVDDLLKMGDDDASQYELRLALSLIARGLLLEAKIFPLSRPELPDQLESIGQDWLAATLRELSSGRPMRAVELSEAALDAHKLLARSDPALNGGTLSSQDAAEL